MAEVEWAVMVITVSIVWIAWQGVNVLRQIRDTLGEIKGLLRTGQSSDKD